MLGHFKLKSAIRLHLLMLILKEFFLDELVSERSKLASLSQI